MSSSSTAPGLALCAPGPPPTPQQQPQDPSTEEAKPASSVVVVSTTDSTASSTPAPLPSSLDRTKRGFPQTWLSQPWRPPPPPSPFGQRPIDLRLQMQPAKLAFIVNRRRSQLERAGFTMREAPGRQAIQEFLEQTRFERQCTGKIVFGPSGDGDNGAPWVGVVDDAKKEDGALMGVGKDSGDDSSGGGQGVAGGLGSQEFEKIWPALVFVYSEELGWAYIHQATKEAVGVVRGLEREIWCQEVGVSLSDVSPKSTVGGMVALFNQTPDVVVAIDGAIAKITGTEEAVGMAFRAIETVAGNGASIAAHWCWEGVPVVSDTCPLIPMSPDTSAGIEKAYAHYKECGNESTVIYTVGGTVYNASFPLMLQKNCTTGFMRPIERVIRQRTALPVPRCPKESMSVTVFREGTTFNVLKVTPDEAEMVRAAVSLTYDRPVVTVEHVWNSFLWGHYAHNAKVIGNENLLFHGAASRHIAQICKTGFDKRLAGSKHGAKYGQGCYFARDASFAGMYMESPVFGQMIMAKVLVGEVAMGDSDMVRPPPLQTAAGVERKYDSTVDCPYSPRIIVTYADWQAYPMYLITFGPSKT